MRTRNDQSELKPGEEFLYSGEVGRWWLQRSMNRSHERAYRNIADFIRASYRRDPKVIVDYACGAGNLLSLLSSRFPNSKLVGLDGSSFLLGLALRRFLRLPRSRVGRISLIETPLPKPNLMLERADLVIFCFPNMMPFSEEEDARGNKWSSNPDDRTIARRLAPDSPGVLEWSRAISCNLWQLLVPNGICVRIEYATVNRHELSPEELRQVSFEEGSLDEDVGGQKPRQWFHVLASAYFRSRVLEDVYQQTEDERDRNGGYLITVLRAVGSKR
jgi:SAM-dependent methyltransferase